MTAQRHEIPTHLDVADRAFAGLTMRQLLSAAVGLTLAYAAVSDLPLPMAPRLVAAAAVLLVTCVLVLWRPGGHPAEEWAFVLLRYAATPRIATWRPGPRPASGAEIHEVVLRAPERHATQRKGVTDAIAS